MASRIPTCGTSYGSGWARDNLRETNAEGAAYAIRLLWSEPARSAADAASEGVTSAFESARTRFDSGALAAADAGFKDIPALSILAVKAAALASARFDVNGGTGWQLPEKESPAITTELSRAMAAQEYAAEAAGYRLLITYRQDLGAMPSAEGGSGTGTIPAAGGFIPTGAPSASPLREAAVLVAARTALSARAVEARAQEAKWTGSAASWEARTALVPGVAPLVDSSRRLAALFRRVRRRGPEGARPGVRHPRRHRRRRGLPDATRFGRRAANQGGRPEGRAGQRPGPQRDRALP